MELLRRFLLFLILLSASAFAVGDKSSGETAVVHGGGLSCFSVPATRDGPPSCDAVCKAKGAACVAIETNGAYDPAIGCGDAALPVQAGDYIAKCRCCAVEH